MAAALPGVPVLQYRRPWLRLRNVQGLGVSPSGASPISSLPLLRPPGTVSPPPPAVAPIAVLVAQAYDVLGSEGMEPFLQAAARCAAGGADNDAADNDAGDSASNECVDMDAASLSTVVGETISCGNLKMRMPSMCDQDSVASVCCATCSS